MSDINFCNTKEQLNHLGEVVTGKVDGSPTGDDIETSTLPYTGQVRKTLPALEEEYQADIDNFVQVSDQIIIDKTTEFDASIASKEAEADAAIDAYRLLSKGPYAAGILLEDKFQYITYNGESYFATNPPYTTTATTPDADGNLFPGDYLTSQQLSLYTDIVYKASGGNSAVENMIAEFTADPLSQSVGTILKTGGTTWEYKDSTGPITIDNFRALNAVSIIDFGADPEGLVSSTEAVQAALDADTRAIFAPSGDYLFDSPVIPFRNFSEITGERGTNFISIGGSSIIRIGARFSAENVVCSNIRFDSDVNGTGTAIDSLSQEFYLSHWHIKDCDFSSFLDYGINANMIGCLVEFCTFGFHQVSTRGLNFKPVKSYGIQSPIAVSNINKFDTCEFARINGVDYPIDVEYGQKFIFDTCIFEQITNVKSVVRLAGVYYPSFEQCWFEANNNFESQIRVELVNGIDSQVLRVEGCEFEQGGGNNPTKAIFDFANTSNYGLSVKNTLFAQGNSPLAVSDAGYGPILTEWSGNRSTNSGIPAQIFDPVKFETGVDTNTLKANLVEAEELRVTGDSTLRITRNYTLQGASLSVDTNIPIPYVNQQAGAMAIVRGTDTGGFSYSAIYNVAVRFGAGSDVEYSLVNEIGGTNPVTFSNNGGLLNISIASGYAAIAFIGF